MRAPKLTEENLRNQVDVVKEEIRLNVLNRPYGGFPWILLPPVLYDTFPNAHNGYGDFTELEQASARGRRRVLRHLLRARQRAGHRRRLPRRRRDAAAGGEALRRHPRPPDPVSGPSFAEPLPGAERRQSVPDAHAPLPALAVGYRLPDPATDLDAYLGHALLGSVLGDGEAARLQRRLVHADGLVTDVSAGAGLMGSLDARDPDTFTITAVHPGNIDPDRVLAAVDEELDKLAAQGPSSDELERQVARWSAALHQENDRVMSPDARPRRPRAAVRARRDRRRAARPARRRHTRAGAGGCGRRCVPVRSRRAARRAPRRGRVEVTRTAEEIGRTAAGPRPLPPLGSTRDVPLPDVEERTLPSGLRVLAARRATVPMVELRLRVPFAGEAPEHPAVAELLSSTLLTGTASRDRVAIDDELAAVGADLGVERRPGTAAASAVRASPRGSPTCSTCSPTS